MIEEDADAWVFATCHVDPVDRKDFSSVFDVTIDDIFRFDRDLCHSLDGVSSVLTYINFYKL